jgi:tRNA(Ile)-lysidine synthase
MKQSGMYQLIEHVGQVQREHQLWVQGSCIIVAVSGGPDSVALLHVLNHFALADNLKLVCAHVNHGFRGEESDREAVFVCELAKQLDIPFELGQFDVPAYMKRTGKGTQVAAREVRYQFLYEVAMKHQATSIALAHHGDDQAETVMLHLLRGSGPTGLAGMRIKRLEQKLELIRPFLQIYKKDLVAVCEEEKIAFVTDSSNFINKYARNAIRLDVLPFLGQYNERLVSALNTTAEIVGTEDDYMAQQTEELYKQLISEIKHGLAFSAKSFQLLHVALQRRLIKLILNYSPFKMEESDFIKIEAIRARILIENPINWKLDLGGRLRCVREYDIISFVQDVSDQNVAGYTYRIDQDEQQVSIPEIRKKLMITQCMASSGMDTIISSANNTAYFDADELEYPLTIRSRLPGDSMRLMGLNGSKKVKDIFIDDKIPPSLRPHIPIISDALGRIIWIAGIRRSALATLHQHTTSIVRMVLVSEGEMS